MYFDFTRLRLYLLALLLMGAFVALLVRLWDLQVSRYAEFAQRIPGSSLSTVRIPGPRGAIRDRHGNALARNRYVFELILNLKDIVNDYRFRHGSLPMTRQYSRGRLEVDIVGIVNETVHRPLVELGLPIAYSSRDLVVHYRSTEGLVPFSLEVDMPFEQFCVVAEHTLDITGVRVEARPIREYPYGALFCHGLGYVAKPNEEKQKELLHETAAGGGESAERAREELVRYDYYVPDILGVTGVEKHLDAVMRGRPGIRSHLRDEKGVYVREAVTDPPQPGADIYLTIDTETQYLVERTMREAGVGVGAAVVMKPATGEILAMVSVPSFDPNRFVPSITGDEWGALVEDPTNPLINRAITDFAPGSIFKIVTSTAACMAGIQANYYYCGGSVSYGGARPMKCWIANKGGAHGSVNLRRALKVSCNCFYYRLGNQVEIDPLKDAARLFGLGEITGIPATREEAGRVPSEEWYSDRGQTWSRALMAQISIGQGAVEMTPLQAANMTATIGNGGICRRPRLIDRVVYPDGVVDQWESEVWHDLVAEGVPKTGIEIIRQGMWDVVNAPGGTASRARIDGFEVAGKTGTSEFVFKGSRETHAWFVGFAPFENPEIAIAVFVFRGKGGGKIAAPIARVIIDQFLKRPERRQFPEVALAEAPGSFELLTEVALTGDGLLEIEAIDTAVEVPSPMEVNSGSASDPRLDEAPTLRSEADIVPEQITQ